MYSHGFLLSIVDCNLICMGYNMGMTGKTKTDLPTKMIEYWINVLLARNDYSTGAQVSQMFLGPGIFVVTLSRPVIIDGQATDLDQTIDIIDLIKSYQAGD